MLPGQAYEEADLQQIHTKAINEADVALLADAWEVNINKINKLRNLRTQLYEMCL